VSEKKSRTRPLPYVSRDRFEVFSGQDIILRKAGLFLAMREKAEKLAGGSLWIPPGDGRNPKVATV